jgi:hypothetical protein
MHVGFRHAPPAHPPDAPELLPPPSLPGPPPELLPDVLLPELLEPEPPPDPLPDVLPEPPLDVPLLLPPEPLPPLPLLVDPLLPPELPLPDVLPPLLPLLPTPVDWSELHPGTPVAAATVSTPAAAMSHKEGFILPFSRAAQPTHAFLARTSRIAVPDAEHLGRQMWACHAARGR